jgi:hypothetical protein
MVIVVIELRSKGVPGGLGTREVQDAAANVDC